jgi:cytochrome c-type biogenesis protein
MTEVSLFWAFLAGVLSFLSPCVLPLVPGYIAIISGSSLEDLRAGQDQKLLAKAMMQSVLFIFGFSLVFISLGATATWIGQVLLQKMSLLNRIAGLLIVLFGLHMTGILKIGLLYRDARVHNTSSPATAAGSFLMGLAFAFGWTPCIGPILAGILAIAASQEHVAQGIFLLGVYSAGLAVPFLATTLGINRFMSFYQRFRKHLHRLEVAAGVLLIVLGALIATNNFGRVSSALAFLNRLAL